MKKSEAELEDEDEMELGPKKLKSDSDDSLPHIEIAPSHETSSSNRPSQSSSDKLKPSLKFHKSNLSHSQSKSNLNAGKGKFFNFNPGQFKGLANIETYVHKFENTFIIKTSAVSDIRNNTRRTIYLWLEDPKSSRAALCINLFIMFCVIMNAAVMSIWTVVNPDGLAFTIWFSIETGFIVIFAIEYVARLYAHSYSWKSLWKFVRQPLSLIDLISFLPHIIELAIWGAHELDTERLSVLRLFKLFRLFKTYKDHSMLQLSIEVMIIAVKNSLDAMAAVLFAIFVAVIVLATLLYYAERGTIVNGVYMNVLGNPSQFSNIPISMYFTAVTLTTTGFGDMLPLTLSGKLLSILTMFVGVILVSLPSIIIGRKYMSVWDSISKYRATLQVDEKNEEEEDLNDVLGNPEVHEEIDEFDKAVAKAGKEDSIDRDIQTGREDEEEADDSGEEDASDANETGDDLMEKALQRAQKSLVQTEKQGKELKKIISMLKKISRKASGL